MSISVCKAHRLLYHATLGLRVIRRRIISVVEGTRHVSIAVVKGRGARDAGSKTWVPDLGGQG